MFENMNPLDRPTAFFEIAVLLLISFVIGFIAARIPISGSTSIKSSTGSKKNKTIIEEEDVDPRDIITEPTTIKAVLTRDRKGNAIMPMDTVKRKTRDSDSTISTPTKIAAIKRDFSKKSIPKITLKEKNPNSKTNKDIPKKD